MMIFALHFYLINYNFLLENLHLIEVLYKRNSSILNLKKENLV